MEPNKKIYFTAKINDSVYNHRIMDYLVSLGAKPAKGYTGEIKDRPGFYYINCNNFVDYTSNINNLTDYELKDIDIIHLEDTTNTNLKECFKLILKRIHGKDLY